MIRKEILSDDEVLHKRRINEFTQSYTGLLETDEASHAKDSIKD
jgi:hypothetical protein